VSDLGITEEKVQPEAGWRSYRQVLADHGLLAVGPTDGDELLSVAIGDHDLVAAHSKSLGERLSWIMYCGYPYQPTESAIWPPRRKATTRPFWTGAEDRR
jgi:hypothetical protein